MSHGDRIRSSSEDVNKLVFTPTLEQDQTQGNLQCSLNTCIVYRIISNPQSHVVLFLSVVSEGNNRIQHISVSFE